MSLLHELENTLANFFELVVNLVGDIPVIGFPVSVNVELWIVLFLLYGGGRRRILWC